MLQLRRLGWFVSPDQKKKRGGLLAKHESGFLKDKIMKMIEIAFKVSHYALKSDSRSYCIAILDKLYL